MLEDVPVEVLELTPEELEMPELVETEVVSEFVLEAFVD